MRLGITEILLILVLALVIFGGSKLSGVGKALGQSIREFKKEVGGKEEVGYHEIHSFNRAWKIRKTYCLEPESDGASGYGG